MRLRAASCCPVQGRISCGGSIRRSDGPLVSTDLVQPISTNFTHTGADNGMFSADLDNLPVCRSIRSGTIALDRCSIAKRYPPVGSILKLRGLLPSNGNASISDGAPVDWSILIAAIELWPRLDT